MPRIQSLYRDLPLLAHIHHFGVDVALREVDVDPYHLILLETAAKFGGTSHGSTGHESVLQQLGGCGPVGGAPVQRLHGRVEEVKTVTPGCEEARHELLVGPLSVTENLAHLYVRVNARRVPGVIVQSRVL
eukprot:CAMPEP_0171066116 /NCGR_PEP_ID=MMETSP0766_2-20121228/7240_1 /TAXON_ID=439317 /ORGANISM="Gambierdiscus australes, Strain CAWD 149" /LENGTH=130 /DNA_ID=CAMNT_0011522271 /DNA_START=569 /DNA_END=961 /DNA_ORIENTATION=-